MNISEAVLSRKSIRGYKSDPVPKEILTKILETATRAPSSDNSQPWEIHVITGEPLENIRKDNLKALTSGVEGNPFPPYEPKFRKRQVDLAIQLFTLMDIGREDKKKRLDWMMRGFRFFDAPVGIIFSAEKSINLQWSSSDTGGLIQTICLLALEQGLGTCIIAQGVTYTDVIREHANIPKDHNILLALAMGYPDDDFPANKVQSERVPLDNNTNWIGF